MSQAVDAVYEDGVFKPSGAVELQDKTRVRLQIEETDQPARTPLGRRLRDLRTQVLESEATPLSWDDISDEVAARRGGYKEPR